ncbi:MAG: chromate transporter, partial [Solirubrobacterales bacterium]|nr:chromate transporter [Solirubrobacterales bacterium]
MAPRSSPATVPQERPRTLGGLVAYFLRLGSWGFGGPIALVGYMHRDLVEERRWFSEDGYRQGMALAQTMPGPLAAQLAMWFGYLERRARSGRRHAAVHRRRGDGPDHPGPRGHHGHLRR